MPSINYTITKTAANEYQMTYSIGGGEGIQQYDAINVAKIDVDGTKTVHKEYLSPSSIAKMTITDSTVINAASNHKNIKIIKGIPINIDTSSLAVGGVCYEIEPEPEWLEEVVNGSSPYPGDL